MNHASYLGGLVIGGLILRGSYLGGSYLGGSYLGGSLSMVTEWSYKLARVSTLPLYRE